MKKELLDFVSPSYREKINLNGWDWKSGIPLKIELHPEQSCNLGCLFCINDEYRTQNTRFERLPVSSYLNFLKESFFLGSQIVSISGGGEPMMYSDFDSLLKESKMIGYNTKLATNGTLFNSKRLRLISMYCDHLRLSLNALCREDYYKIMKRDKYDLVIDNLYKIIDKKRTSGTNLFIEISFQITNLNFEIILANIADFIREFDVQKINLEIPYDAKHETINKVSSDSFAGKIQELIARFPDIITSNIDIAFESTKPFWNCIAPYFKVAVNNDGQIHPCCQLADNGGESFPEYIIGNIMNQSAREIWLNAPQKTKLIKPQLCSDCISSDYKLNRKYGTI